MRRHCGERTGASGEGDIIHLNAEAFHHTHGILQTCVLATDHMHIHLKSFGKPANRALHAVLTIHPKMLANGVQHLLAGGQLWLGLHHHLLNVIRIDLAVHRRNRVDSAVVEGLDVCAGHAEINAADFDVGTFLRTRQGFPDGIFRALGVDDLTLAHRTARGRLPNADHT